eukprot:7727032-Pyramimonas_sp.AAC.1
MPTAELSKLGADMTRCRRSRAFDCRGEGQERISMAWKGAFFRARCADAKLPRRVLESKSRRKR